MNPTEHLSPRTGSVFIMALAIISILTVMAAVFLSTARQTREAAVATNSVLLARMTARAGTDHALALLRHEYLTTPGEPTNLHQRWRTAFDGIGTQTAYYDAGDGTGAQGAAVGYSRRTPGAPVNLNEDDVKFENLLWEPLLNPGPSGYQLRNPWDNDDPVGTLAYNAMEDSEMNTSKISGSFGLMANAGRARYFEPGYFNAHPGWFDSYDAKPYDQSQAKMVTFDDSKVFHGEGSASPGNAGVPPYVPSAADLASHHPLCLDAEWRPLQPGSDGITTWKEARARARYRLRYAVAIEDLSGHLGAIPPGTLVTAASNASLNGGHFYSASFDEQEAWLTQTGTVTTGIANPRQNSQSQNPITLNWHPYSFAFANMAAWHGCSPEDARDALDGRGTSYPAYTDGTTATIKAISGMEFLQRSPWLYNLYDRDGARAVGRYDGSVLRQVVGAFNSPEQINAGLRTNPLQPTPGLIFTPFARRAIPNVTDANGASCWDYGPSQVAASPNVTTTTQTDTVACLWRVNALTVPTGVFRTMLWSYLPAEAKECNTTVHKWKITGKDGRGGYIHEASEQPGYPLFPVVRPALPTYPQAIQGIFGGAVSEDANLSGTLEGKEDINGNGILDTGSAYPPKIGNYVWKKTEGANCMANLMTIDGKPDNLKDANNPERPRTRGECVCPDSDSRWLRKFEMADRMWQQDANGNGDIGAGDWYWKQDKPATELWPLSAAAGFTNADSYFLDMASAAASAMAVVRTAWSYKPMSWFWSSNGLAYDYKDAAKATVPATANLASIPAESEYFAGAVITDAAGDGIQNDQPSKFDTIEELDRLFVKNMGEHWTKAERGIYPAYAAPAFSLRQRYDLGGISFEAGIDPSHASFQGPGLATAPARTIQCIGVLDADPDKADKANAMELALNDFRMSFFAGGYPIDTASTASNAHAMSTFRPKDFSGDGIVYCSGYGWAGSQPVGPNLPAGSTAGDAGDGPALTMDQIRSVTGYFVMQKSHFYRIMVRGEVWDQVRQRIVNQANLETVYAVDPGATANSINASTTTVFKRDNTRRASTAPASLGAELNLNDCQVLFQKWYPNQYRRLSPDLYP